LKIMNARAFQIGDRVRFKLEDPPRIATVLELLEGGWLMLYWAGPPESTSSCDSEDVALVRAAPATRK
jgi:hypothetical protein